MMHKWMVSKDAKNPNLIYVRRYRNIDLAKEVLKQSGTPMGKDDCVRFLNGDRRDCRRENLEKVCRRKILQARRRGNKTSTFLGVCLNRRKRRFTAQLSVNGKQIHVGSFRSELQAAKAWNIAAFEAYGLDTYFNRVPDWGLPEGAEYYPGA